MFKVKLILSLFIASNLLICPCENNADESSKTAKKISSRIEKVSSQVSYDTRKGSANYFSRFFYLLFFSNFITQLSGQNVISVYKHNSNDKALAKDEPMNICDEAHPLGSDGIRWLVMTSNAFVVAEFKPLTKYGYELTDEKGKLLTDKKIDLLLRDQKHKDAISLYKYTVIETPNCADFKFRVVSATGKIEDFRNVECKEKSSEHNIKNINYFKTGQFSRDGGFDRSIATFRGQPVGLIWNMECRISDIDSQTSFIKNLTLTESARSGTIEHYGFCKAGQKEVQQVALIKVYPDSQCDSESVGLVVINRKLDILTSNTWWYGKYEYFIPPYDAAVSWGKSGVYDPRCTRIDGNKIPGCSVINGGLKRSDICSLPNCKAVEKNWKDLVNGVCSDENI